MKNSCPGCKSEKCYISFLNVVECSNEDCRYYSSSLYPKQLPVPEADEVPLKEEDTNPGTPMFFWSNYHTDCGDC